VNIRYNLVERRFEVDFSTDFAGDLGAVKNAKWHTTGPPDWVWYAPGIKALNRLREKRPASGLTITPEALAIYTPLAAQEAKNDAIRKQLAEARKKAKKEQKQDDANESKCLGDDFPLDGNWEKSDPPPQQYVCSYKGVISSPPDLKCIYCKQPVYWYEQESPPVCFWCEKQRDIEIALDIKSNL
jgi:hypothetical protein